jgi:hypothetical protein
MPARHKQVVAVCKTASFPHSSLAGRKVFVTKRLVTTSATNKYVGITFNIVVYPAWLWPIILVIDFEK